MNVQTKLASKVGKVVNTQHAEELIHNYKKERWAHSSRRMGKPDSLSVWYSVEELEDFLTMIKEAGGDGVKLHFGAYSEEFAARPEYAGRQTVVMLGTKAKEVDGKVVNKNIYQQSSKGTSLLAYNFGTLCPPTCGTGDQDSISISITDQGECGISVG